MQTPRAPSFPSAPTLDLGFLKVLSAGVNCDQTDYFRASAAWGREPLPAGRWVPGCAAPPESPGLLGCRANLAPSRRRAPSLVTAALVPALEDLEAQSHLVHFEKLNELDWAASETGFCSDSSI